MDALRWILLGIGVLAVVGIYFYSRSKSDPAREDYTTRVDDVPSVSLEDDGDAWKDGVGPVRVVKQEQDVEEVLDELKSDLHQPNPAPDADTPEAETGTDAPESRQADTIADATEAEAVSAPEPEPEPEAEEPQTAHTSSASSLPEVIALHVVAKDRGEMKGEQILSATYAVQLQHGDMNIFHRHGIDGDIEFSMANMQKPGDFDLSGMHDMTTRGVSLFFQPPLVADPPRVLDDMLLCAHTLSGMLNGDIITEDKIRLDETSARRLRASVKTP